MADNDITAILVAAGRSAETAAATLDQLIPLVYEELRSMASRQLARERNQLTLDTTALVHEAYLKLVDQTRAPVKSRSYFFGAAARAMRQVLVDAARRRRRVKRGAGQRPLPLEEDAPLDQGTRVAVDDLAVQVLDLDKALAELESDFPRAARVVECRFFAGLSVEETAQALEVSERTVKGDWALARAWIYDELSGTA